jgi:polyhydroxybutyrate depolymerase
MWAVLACLLLPSLAGAEPVIGPGTHGTIDLRVGDLRRDYEVHVPKGYDPRQPKPMPLVMMLHGAGGDADGSRRRYGWAELADRETFLAVFPEGTPAMEGKPPSFATNPRLWNDGSGRGGVAARNVDDVGYLKAVLDDAGSRWKIDRDRVYVTGFSNGSSMTWRVGVELADRIAAIAPMSGHLWLDHPASAGGRVPACLFLVGDADPLNPILGGDSPNPWGGRSQKPPYSQSIERWCAMIGAPTVAPKVLRDEGGVRAVEYAGKDGRVLRYYVVAGLGHTWPGVREVLPEALVGKSTDKLNATDLAWQFLKQHRRGE